MEVEVVYFPDLANTYAIEATSYLAKHKLTVGVAKGLLSSVAFDSSQTGVASQLIESAAAVEAKRVEAAAAAAKAEAAEVAAAEAAVAAAQKALDAARAELTALLENNGTESEIRAARVKIAVAEANLAAAQAALQRVSPSAPANAPKEGETSNAAEFPLQARGPVFFEIVDRMEKGKNVVGLVAKPLIGAERQPKFPTAVRPEPPAQPSPLPAPKLYPEHVFTVTPGKGGLVEVRIHADSPISRLLLEESTLEQEGVTGPLPLPKSIALMTPTEIRVVFPPAVKAGTYFLTLELEYTAGDEAKDGSDQVTFVIFK
jgi:hypothetical protein